MSITEPERHELYEIVKDRLGPRGADLFMTALPPHADQLVTKADLRHELSDLRGSMLRTMGTWLFASQAAVIAAISLVVAID